MAFFAWDEMLSVGNTCIDNDHHHLIELLNHLHTAVGENKGPDIQESVLSDLIEYTQEHFKREEHMMQAIHYTGLANHKDEHDKLTREVLEMQLKFVAGETNLSSELMMFLFDWLFEHIMKQDKTLAQSIQDAKAVAKDQAMRIRLIAKVGDSSTQKLRH